MTFNKTIGLSIAILALNFGFLQNLNAGIIVKCETRGISRSKVSVDGTGLPNGAYYAIAYSPLPTTNFVRSKLPNKIASSSNKHQVEFDFDSDPSNVAAGATKISPTFIKNRAVYGYIRTSTGAPVAALRATCVAK
jgi:hypothetical protein